MARLFPSWRAVPASLWRWPNFSPAEIACRGTGNVLIHEPALDALQALRDKLGKPLLVTSAYRSPAHNRKVGGASGSKHLEGHAFDISMANHDPAAFEAAANECGFLGIGHYPRSNFMHIDLGPVRRWNEGGWFPAQPTSFTPEPPRPLPRAETAVGTGTVGGAGTLVTLGPAIPEVLDVVTGQQVELSSGDIGRIVVAMAIIGLTLFMIWRQVRR